MNETLKRLIGCRIPVCLELICIKAVFWRKLDCIDLNRIPGEVKFCRGENAGGSAVDWVSRFGGRRFEYLPVDSDHEPSRPNLSIGRESLLQQFNGKFEAINQLLFF